MDFSGFHWISLDFIGFHWISLDFIGFHIIPTPKKVTKTEKNFMCLCEVEPYGLGCVVLSVELFDFSNASYI